MVHDPNKLDSSDQTKAGTRSETEVWIKSRTILDKRIMSFRLECRNWNAETRPD